MRPVRRSSAVSALQWLVGKLYRLTFIIPCYGTELLLTVFHCQILLTFLIRATVFEWCFLLFISVSLLTSVIMIYYSISRYTNSVNALMEDLFGKPTLTVFSHHINGSTTLRRMTQKFRLGRCFQHDNCTIHSFKAVYNENGRTNYAPLFQSHNLDGDRNCYRSEIYGLGNDTLKYVFDENPGDRHSDLELMEIAKKEMEMMAIRANLYISRR